MPRFELNLDHVLMSGQTFRWQRDDDGWWISAIGAQIVLRLRQNGDSLEYEALDGSAHEIVSAYFHFDKSLAEIRENWAAAGEHNLVESVDKAPGLRVVQQDPVECLFSFLCSSAAPIHRIRRSVSGMCQRYGKSLGTWHGVNLCGFPDVESLADAKREELDSMGLGFRGRYVIETARAIADLGGRVWLDRQRFASYSEAKEALVTLPGVGEKVADCVCLFSLDKHEAVPIDVHIARVARRLFDEVGENTSLTPKTYTLWSELFRQRYGEIAGWAQQYFFFAEIERRGLWDQELGKHRPRQSDTGPLSHR